LHTLHSAFGYVVLLSIAWLLGRRTRHVPWKTVVIATFLQLVLAGLLLRTGLRTTLFGIIGTLTRVLQTTALQANQSLLFSGVSNPEFTKTYGPMIALDITAILVFVASVARILYHYRILPWIIDQLSRAMQYLLGISAAESVGTAANVFLGMTEAPLLIRPYVARMTESELFCLMTSGLATIAGTVMVLYAAILQSAHPEIAGHLFTASLISAPAAIAIAKLMIPETGQPETAGQHVSLQQQDTINGIDAAARGAAEGIQLVINIIAMLIAFIGLVALANWGIGVVDGWFNGAAAGGWSLQAAAGWLFRPFVWLMGVSWQESQTVGELMGLKTTINEFVAYVELSGRMAGTQPLSERHFLITTYAMCGFANFGSIAIMIGGIGGVAPNRRQDLARLGLHALLGGTIATMLTGAIAGLYV
jgi:CNT family concentrative nucleoside transporter